MSERTVRVRLRGELDLASSSELLHAVRAIATRADGDVARIELDLTELTFCDAAGVAALMRLGRECERGGREVVLRRPAGAVRRVFEIVDLAGSLQVVDS